MPPTLRFLSFALLVVAGCASTLGQGKSAFEKGRYPLAKRELLAVASDYPTWDAREQAEFALYLGLTHAELGDVAQAQRWLETAKALEDARRGTLSEEDWRRVELALEALEPPVTP